MSLSVIIPSYARAEALGQCLRSIELQICQPKKVIVVRQLKDEGTATCIAAFKSSSLSICEVIVTESGLIAAMRAGLAEVDTNIVVFTDDDIVAPIHWLETINRLFEADERTGGVGGRDILPSSPEPGQAIGPAKVVGRASLFGRTFGNHHIGIKEPFHYVHVLKGVNMAFRTHLLRDHLIGDGLRGSGAQVGTEWGICWAVRRQGYHLLYHSDLWLDHHALPRQAFDARADSCGPEAQARLYNNGFCAGHYFPLWSTPGTLAWNCLVGSRHHPGFLRWFISRGVSLHLNRRFQFLWLYGFAHGMKKRALMSLRKTRYGAC